MTHVSSVIHKKANTSIKNSIQVMSHRDSIFLSRFVVCTTYILFITAISHHKLAYEASFKLAKLITFHAACGLFFLQLKNVR